MTKKFSDGQWKVWDNGTIHTLLPHDPPYDCMRRSEVVFLDSRTEEHRANARLVSAAPLMYEKLHQAVNKLQEYAPYADLVSHIKELLMCIDDEEQAEYTYAGRKDVYIVPMPDGMVMLYERSALQKIISEHKEMKELLTEFYEVREAESSAMGRRVRAEHRTEDFLKRINSEQEA